MFQFVSVNQMDQSEARTWSCQFDLDRIDGVSTKRINRVDMNI